MRSSNLLPVRVETPAPAKNRTRAKSVEVARVAVVNPLKLGKLRAAVALGAELSVAFDGYTLTVRASR